MALPVPKPYTLTLVWLAAMGLAVAKETYYSAKKRPTIAPKQVAAPDTLWVQKSPHNILKSLNIRALK
jgi:hypothetical protein